MNDNIVYRPLTVEDADDLASILAKTWHQDADGEVRHLQGLIDFAIYAQQPTWAQVAQKDGRAVGVIMARAGASDQELGVLWKQIEQNAWARLREISDGQADELQAFFKSLDTIDEQLLEESGCDSTYELVVFAVSPEMRGCGVGGTLLRAAQDYLRSQGAAQAFFYTDTSCNWQYYEHRGMKRVAGRVLDPDKFENAAVASMMPERMFVYEMVL